MLHLFTLAMQAFNLPRNAIKTARMGLILQLLGSHIPAKDNAALNVAARHSGNTQIFIKIDIDAATKVLAEMLFPNEPSLPAKPILLDIQSFISYIYVFCFTRIYYVGYAR